MNNEIKSSDNEVVENEDTDITREKPDGLHNQHESQHHHSGHHHHSSSHHSSHGSHSGHHYHSGHKEHHKKHKHGRSGQKNKLKVNTKLMLILSIVLLVVLIAAVIIAETVIVYNENNDQSQGENSALEVLEIEVINDKGVLVNDAVSKYVLTDLLNPYNSNVLPSDFSNGEARLDAQVPVAIKLSTKDGSALFYKIELADNENFENANISYVNSSVATYEFEHLYVNTTYFYRVTVYTKNGAEAGIGSFKTANTPRILSIDGLSNVRDIGNWKTDSGKRIKQGLLIRGTEMDGAVESGYHLTNEGLKDMLDVFSIKTDIDLRTRTSTSMDALGSRVEHRYYSMVVYSEIFTDEGKEKIRMVFADLANPDNYPIYLHCTYGCDRTGTVCYLLEALLGVSRGDCLKDYGLSNLKISSIQVVEDGLKDYEGSTLKEQTESYLLSCGVSEYQIESIRNIFLGD